MEFIMRDGGQSPGTKKRKTLSFEEKPGKGGTRSICGTVKSPIVYSSRREELPAPPSALTSLLAGEKIIRFFNICF
jgi:hypothetical protein